MELRHKLDSFWCKIIIIKVGFASITPQKMRWKIAKWDADLHKIRKVKSRDWENFLFGPIKQPNQMWQRRPQDYLDLLLPGPSSVCSEVLHGCSCFAATSHTVWQRGSVIQEGSLTGQLLSIFPLLTSALLKTTTRCHPILEFPFQERDRRDVGEKESNNS